MKMRNSNHQMRVKIKSLVHCKNHKIKRRLARKGQEDKIRLVNRRSTRTLRRRSHLVLILEAITRQ